MKKSFYVFLLLGFALGCGSEEKLVFSPHQMQWEVCEKCPKVEVNTFRVMNNTPVARAINNALEEEITKLLPFSEKEKVNRSNHASTATAGSEGTEQKDEKINWETKINGEIVYEGSRILTVMLSAYTYAGGAHGDGSTTYLNFDKKNGKVIENHDLFDDVKDFQVFAEDQFRKQKNIPSTANINATGFMFEGNTFYLPENIGYTPDGLQLVYNPYEIASYAEGIIVLTLPYAEVNSYLRREGTLE